MKSSQDGSLVWPECLAHVLVVKVCPDSRLDVLHSPLRVKILLGVDLHDLGLPLPLGRALRPRLTRMLASVTASVQSPGLQASAGQSAEVITPLITTGPGASAMVNVSSNIHDPHLDLLQCWRISQPCGVSVLLL